MPVTPNLKINLGSFNVGHPDWLSIDNDFRIKIGSSQFLAALAKLLIRTRIVKRNPSEVIVSPPVNYMSVNLLKAKLPFKDNQVRYCYMSHFLEHMPRSVSRKLLLEVHRVLTNDGVIRVVVPDLDKIVEAFHERNGMMFSFWNSVYGEYNSPVAKFNAYFGRFDEDDPLRLSKTEKLGRRLLKRISHYSGHQWMYNFEDLKELLSSTEFHDIQRTNFRLGKTPNLDFLDFEKYQLESLYVEAVK